jgi:hypothetical protein
MSNLSTQTLAENAADIFLCDLFTLDPTIARRFGRRLREERAGFVRVWAAMLRTAGEAERLRPLISGLLDGFRLQGANVDDQAIFGLALVRVLRSAVGRQGTGVAAGWVISWQEMVEQSVMIRPVCA